MPVVHAIVEESLMPRVVFAGHDDSPIAKRAPVGRSRHRRQLDRRHGGRRVVLVPQRLLLVHPAPLPVSGGHEYRHCGDRGERGQRTWTEPGRHRGV
jgi:hypothetical protein